MMLKPELYRTNFAFKAAFAPAFFNTVTTGLVAVQLGGYLTDMEMYECQSQYIRRLENPECDTLHDRDWVEKPGEWIGRVFPGVPIVCAFYASVHYNWKRVWAREELIQAIRNREWLPRSATVRPAFVTALATCFGTSMATAATGLSQYGTHGAVQAKPEEIALTGALLFAQSAVTCLPALTILNWFGNVLGAAVIRQGLMAGRQKIVVGRKFGGA